MKKIIYLLLLVGNIIISKGEEIDTTIFDVSSPYSTVLSHLYFLQPETYRPDLSAQTLEQQGLSQEEAIKFSKRIKYIFDGKGLYIDLNKIPHKIDYSDSTGKEIYVVTPSLPQIYLIKVNERWLYSEKTISQVNAIYRATYPFFTYKLLEWVPHKASTKKYLGLYLWQFGGIFILILTCFILHKILVILFEKILIGSIARFRKAELAHMIIQPVAKPISFFVVFGLISLVIPVLQLPSTANHYIILTLSASLPFFIMMVFYKLVDVLCSYLEKLAEKTESTLDDQLIPLVRKSLKVFVIVIGTIFILQNLNFNVMALLAGISFGGIALAFAAQDTLKNFFGSLMIFVDRPFQIGDWIIADGIDGNIEEVGFRSTRIRTFYNSVISVPNGNLADATIDNMGLRQYRRFKTSLALTYDTPPELIEVFIEGLEKIVLEHQKTRKDYYNIYMNDMGSHSLNILFYIFFDVATWPEELKGRHEVIISILKLADVLGVRFAFPTQTLHMEDFPEKNSLTPQYEQIDKISLREKINKVVGIKTIKE